jgi:beta-phosphoglucomutase-like phosphatase (HAD superfamily)
MTAATAAPREVGKARRRPASPLVTRPGPSGPRRTLDLDAVALGWQRTFDATDHALAAVSGFLPESSLRQERSALTQERQQTATMLADLARLAGIHPAPWLSQVPVSAKMLGVPATIRACLFDLDGVLTDSGVLHALAWAEAFDPFLLRVSEHAGWRFIPFDRADYDTYLDGHTRLEGVHAFLASRGIHLPEGRADDSSEAETAFGLARRKSEALTRGLSRHGVNALGGARRYLEACGFAGVGRGVVSASTRTLPMLELAGLATLVEKRVDAESIRTQGLRSRPAPDLLLAACARLGVGPDETVTFTHSPAGVAAGHTARMAVIGVGTGKQAELLRGFGAELVVDALSSLLDRRLAPKRA